MSRIFSIDKLDFHEDPASIENFKIQTAFPRLSNVVKSEHLIFDVRKLDPGQFSFPYHFHRHAEELMYVVSGSMTLRSAEGFQTLEPGDIVFFEKGESGVHQLCNHTNNPCMYLDIKTALSNDVCEYPDSNKVGISPYREIFEKNSGVDYFKGEENIKERWQKMIDDQ